MSPIAPGLIDVHAHVVLEASLGEAGLLGPTIATGPDGQSQFRVADWCLDGVDYRGTPFMDADLRLARMDEVGIGHQALTPNPLTWFHHVDGAVAVRYCREHNRALAEHIAVAPTRLSGLAQLPAQEPAAAARELEQSVTELGLRGGAMGTDPGVPIDDDRLAPIWDAAEALDVPLFLHPAPSGIDGPVIDHRAARHDFELHGWFCHEETLAVVALVFGGVLDRHPGLDICISHGGGSVALLYERLRHAMASRPSGSGAAADLDRGLRRLWFDNHMGDRAAVGLLAERVGADRLVLGTNFAGWDDRGPEPFGIEPRVLTGNARRLLRLDR